MAERLRSGLQIRVHRFESGPGLQFFCSIQRYVQAGINRGYGLSYAPASSSIISRRYKLPGTYAMDPLVISLVLAAAVSHAVWNAVVKSSGDRLITMAIIMGTGGVLAIPAVIFLPLPHADAWP